MLLLAALWIGMSAQAQTQWASQPSSDCSFGELITVGQNQVVAMCLGGKWVVADWVANAAQKEISGSNEGNGGIVFDNTHLIQNFNLAAQRAAEETDGLTHCMKSDGTHDCMDANGNGYRVVQGAKPAEPVDVPAVQVVHERWIENCLGNCLWKDDIHTCTDKSRILLHDESNPAKFWCHRVQP